MPSDHATEVVNRMIEEIQNRGNIALVDELFAADFVNHSARPDMPQGRDGMRQLFSGMRDAFTDGRIEILDQISDGRKVWTRKKFSGTHTGQFHGAAPTGRTASYEVIDIILVEDNEIKEHWSVLDRLDFLRQVGLLSES
ncbi:ester cyclase [uncultured Sneathiella sp.]|uniref:ester cyclase n=1 Tax=uncultured Sneathiella sp. TaxID=879315 RepID=UPI0030EBCAE3|tara:strand:- start:15081 stop:15500 length:420 start_codon:yes stop_codon:yes gene_type:complete